jgi:hypothetical protein
VNEEYVEIVRGVLDRRSEGDMMAGAGFLDPHVVFVVPPAFPGPAVVVGPDSVADYCVSS